MMTMDRARSITFDALVVELKSAPVVQAMTELLTTTTMTESPRV